MKYIIYTTLFVAILSCNETQETAKFDKEQVKKQVREMLSDYYADISKEGLLAEFSYLDKSDDFFWVPPEFESTLTYDSVKTLIEQNARLFQSVDFKWVTLRVFPLTNEIANFSGTLNGKMIDTTGFESKITIIESGTTIKRREGWKLLNGQTSIVKTKQKIND